MNFVQSGDLHLRVKPDLPEAWQLHRYHCWAAEIIDLCKKYEAKLFLSGDLFDRNRPSLIELQLFIEIMICISDADIDAWVIAGNHEVIGQSTSTFDYFTDIFDSINRKGRGQIFYRTSNVMVEHFQEERVTFTFIGHPALKSQVNHVAPKGATQILVSHFRPTVNQFIKEEIDVAAFIHDYEFCFASDIHEAIELHDGKLVYTNSPLNCQFEAKPDGGCLLITADDGFVQWKRIPLRLPNLIQISTTAEDYREPPEDGNFYRIELKGSSSDLRTITTEAQHIKLLKVPEIAETYAEQETEEISDQVLEEALIEYMESLKFAPSKIQNMMEVFREP